MKNRQKMGARAEVLAARFLKSKGWTLVDQNWRCSGGELDLVCKRGNRILFAEVRSTCSNYLGGVEVTVDQKKQRKVARAAELWLSSRASDCMDYQFDVLTVYFEGSGRGYVEHYPDAFVSPWAF